MHGRFASPRRGRVTSGLARVRAAATGAIERLEDRRLMAADFNLQLLHASDFEAGLAAVQDAPRFAAVLDALEETYPNTLRLSSGDNYLPGPFFNAGGDPALDPVLGGAGAASVGRADIEILNRLGIQASTIGNHEFDAGPREFRNIFAPAGNWRGAQFPYLSSNLTFATDPDLSPAAFNAAPGQEASAVRGKLTKSTVVTVNGQRVGIVGATTPQLESISSTGGVGVRPADDNDMAALAAIIQPEVDALVNAGINKIVVATHLQQLTFERQLAPLLRNVDVLIGGGSNTLLADATDRLRAGDARQGNYPELFTNASGDPLALINTDGNFKYVGRLIAGFDAAGRLVDFDDNPATPFFDPAQNGAHAADEQGVRALYPAAGSEFAAGTKGAAVKQVADAIAGVINTKDAQIFGQTDVYLEGRRNQVRSQETNLGNLSNDANLAEARDVDPTVAVSIKNGGGIRDSIGAFAVDGTPQPPAANPAAGKQAGDISRLDVENSLRFNNQLAVATITAAQLKVVLEHAVAAVAPGATPGQFPQVGGLAFSFDPARTAQVIAGNPGTGVATVTTPGQRVRSLALTGADGSVTDVVVQNGAVVGDPNRLVRLVTLNFLLDDPDNDGRGGDNYPLPSFDQNRVNLTNGGEQAALAEYLQERFPAAGPNARAYAEPETPPAQDRRIQNLAARPDAVLASVFRFAQPAYSVREGQPVATIAVTRSGNTLSAASVNYATADGSAVAPVDYAATRGTLSFAPGEATKSFTVPIVDDREADAGETLTLALSGAAPGDSGTAELRIFDDEVRDVLADDVILFEGNAGTRLARFRVKLSSASDLPVTVRFATADGNGSAASDYAARSGTLAFAPGEADKFVDVPVRGDATFEPDEAFYLTLSDPTNAGLLVNRATAVVLNDDARPALRIADVARRESNGGSTDFAFTVSLSNPTAAPVTVRFATKGNTAQSGRDFAAAHGTLTFAPGQTSRTIVVRVAGDRAREGAETFFVDLSRAAGAAIADGRGVGTILNDD